jgi:uncharacterized membrane protein YhhN
MFNEYFFLVFSIAIVDWYAVWKGNNNLRYLTKPLTLMALILWFTISGGWQGPTAIFGVGLIFSLAGDIFLLKNLVKARPSFFQLGLVSFLIVQGLYIIGLNGTIPSVSISIVVLLCIAGIIAFFITRYIVGGLRRTSEGKKQQAPVILYMMALSLMFFSAALTLLRPEWTLMPACLVSIGGALFFTSDTVLASNEFVKPYKYAGIILIITYHLAQIAIVSGVLLGLKAG